MLTPIRFSICIFAITAALITKGAVAQNIIQPQPATPNKAIKTTPSYAFTPKTLQAEPRINLIDQLTSEFTWNRHPEKQQVKDAIKGYLEKPSELRKILSRSQLFLPLIAQSIREQNLPTELAFLPMVESGFIPSATSNTGATGLWQIMPKTAKHLNMKVNWWYDERIDIVSSTDGALKYLKHLNKSFDGDWALAIAAYNGGEDYLRKKIKLQEADPDFWQLSLNQEAKKHLPKLLALCELLINAEKYNIKLPQMRQLQGLRSILVKDQFDLRRAAHNAGLTYQYFKMLNPGLKRWFSPPKGEYPILVPRDRAEQFQNNLFSAKIKGISKWTEYVIQENDDIIEIARQHGTTIKSILTVNKVPNGDLIAGKKLLIPIPNNQNHRNKKDNDRRKVYVVKSGDTLWRVARNSGVSVAQIRRLNSLTKASSISPGQVLILKTRHPSNKLHKVVKGNTIYGIARQYKTSVDSLMRLNKLTKLSVLPIGLELKIPN